MDLDDIKELIELMKENDLSELQLDRDGLKVSLKRGPGGISKEILYQAPPAASAAPAPAAPEVSANTHMIKSPMVGTFYRSPSPEAQPFVSNGKTVGMEDTVCIIEAMKVMNEIKAEIRGTIVEVMVENGEAVEFGQPLFKVEKS